MKTVSLSQIKELITQSEGENSRIPKEVLQLFLRKPISTLLKGPYFITVDLKKTIQEMVEDGNYKTLKTQNTFYDSYVLNEKSTYQATLALLCFNERVSIKTIIETVEYVRKNVSANVRLAGIAELLAFGSQYSLIQCSTTIFALEKVFTKSSKKFVPVLGRDCLENRRFGFDELGTYEKNSSFLIFLEKRLSFNLF